MIIANGSIPRGGKLNVKIEELETGPRFTITTSGTMLRVPPKFLELHSTGTPTEPIDAHSIQAYYTLLLASESKMEISIVATAEDIQFSAINMA